MRKPRRNPKSELQFFRIIPPEIVIDILSRLPIRTIAECKCVCSSWRDLLQTAEFAHTHLSKSVAGLIFGFKWDFLNLKILEFVDERGLDFESHDLHYSLLTKFNSSMGFNQRFELLSSANGLLFTRFLNPNPNPLFICNPITREYIQIPSTENSLYRNPAVITYGFGVSRKTRRYKLVRVLHEYEDYSFEKITNSGCHVYTLGTGIWRSVGYAPPFENFKRINGLFLNGNLHWLVDITDASLCIICFDLETEVFSTFSPPRYSEKYAVVISALGDCLCVCDNSSEDDVVVWLMKEYGDEKSWTKQFVIRKSTEFVTDSDSGPATMYPVKVFKDGDILMVCFDMYAICYSNKTKTTIDFDMLGVYDGALGFGAMLLHTPSFLSLRSFQLENVGSF
ncbi:hypothetical protein ABFS83_03G113900 [Erythranthe nasuta]